MSMAMPSGSGISYKMASPCADVAPPPSGILMRRGSHARRMADVDVCMSIEPPEMLANECAAPSPWSPLDDILETINQIDFNDPDSLIDFIDNLPEEISDALRQAGFDLQTDREAVIAVLANWLINEKIGRISRAVRTFVRQTLVNVEAEKIDEAKAALTLVRILNDW